ncbi:hypothetical protein PtrSN002B_003701 [Pyrenophora tritici-repentis]|nr:hypothetical protein PtrSN001A_000177 [Pyrenophora tritici-repentis]KAI1554746.1 hypothetical protein PtrSN002B_003701 [Pyrenophora tritici-repentis]KAI1589001.1 hypothetical protein PtrEW7m1_000242 [Pyrenophora tritici-repentis]KAI1602167.1 hypothetical protein PtrEW13061_000189 [Pyrenophora tritici-repentis]PWO26616.1 CaiC, Acyl-CoA synthetase (AMP-forming)AMP-acid ligase II [Pyrenophora tritici-repentis]
MRFSTIITTAPFILTVSAAVVAPVVVRETSQLSSTDTNATTSDSEQSGEVFNMLRLLKVEGQPDVLEAFNITFTEDKTPIISSEAGIEKAAGSIDNDVAAVLKSGSIAEQTLNKKEEDQIRTKNQDIIHE